MFDKIDVRRILRDHLATLRDERTGKRSLPDILLFFILPVAAAVLVPYSRSLKPDTIGILLTSLSVFAALLFNFLLLVYDVTQRQRTQAVQAQSDLERELQARKLGILRETYDNVSFCILVSVLGVVALLASLMAKEQSVVARVLSGVSCYLVCVFLLTLFMVLKRVHILVSVEITH